MRESPDLVLEFLCSTPGDMALLPGDQRAFVLGHVRTCAACRWAARAAVEAAREFGKGEEAEPAGERAARIAALVLDRGIRPGPRPLLRRVAAAARRIPPAAASVLLALGLASGIALAAAFLWRGPLFVGSSPGGGGRAGEVGLRSRCDFEAAGVGPQSEVLSWVSFVLPGDGLGCGAALVRDDDRLLDFAAFGPGGAPVWVASRDWPEWRATLGGPEVALLGVHDLVLRREDGLPAESLLFVLVRKDRACLLLVDPLTGRFRGPPTFHLGFLAPGDGERTTVSALPGTDRSSRTLLVAGQWRNGEDVAPCLLVLSPGGGVLQHLGLATLGLARPDALAVREMRVDWSPDRPEVTLETSDHLLLRFLVKGGLLDRASVRVEFADHLRPRYDERFGAGAWKRRVEEAGGEEALSRSLGEALRDLPLEPPATWGPR